MTEHAKIRAVRMSDELWKQVEREAARQGVSAAQFLREAAIWRLAYHTTKRGELDLDAFLARFARVAELVLRRKRLPRASARSGLPALVSDSGRGADEHAA